PGRRLIVRERVEIDRAVRHGQRVGARLRRNNLRVLEVRGGSGTRGELGRELTEAEMLALDFDEPERGRVPEAGRSAVAQHDLVAIGEREELAESSTHPPYLRLDGLLPVAGAEVRGRDLGQRSDLLGSHFGRACTEAAVARP